MENSEESKNSSDKSTNTTTDKLYLGIKIAIIIAATMLLIAIFIFNMNLGIVLQLSGYVEDFKCYYGAAECLSVGDNPYTCPLNLPYIYPLFLAVILIPITILQLLPSKYVE